MYLCMSVTVEWLTMQSDVKGIHYLAGEKGGQHIISGIKEPLIKSGLPKELAMW